jgi:hypothetical protein
METAMEWLVIIISVMLGLFLTLSIILILKIIPIVNNLKDLTDKADSIANSIESAAQNAKKVAPLATIFKMFYQAKNSNKGD